MFSIKKIVFSNLFLVIFFFLGNVSPSLAAVISSSNIDTYVLTLKGNELNNVSGLNITVETKYNKSDISPGVTFSSNRATIILSSVTSPSVGQDLITLVLTGKIKDGQATVTGKFVANSIIPGAEFNVLKIERDGGTNITNLLTNTIEFKNSKAPLPTPTPEEEEPTPTPADDATTVPLSEEGQEIVDVFFGDEDEVDSSILNEAVEEALALSEDSLALIGSQELKLKSLGLSKYYVRLKGILDAKNYDGLVCTVRTSTYEGKETIKENFLVDPEYFKLSKNEFNLRLPSKSAKYRFDRRIKIQLLPIGTGLNLLKKRIGSIDMRIKIFCVSYKSNDPELLQYLEDEELSLKDLSIVDVLTYPRDARNIRTYVDLVDLDIFAPESVKVHK